MTPCPCGSGGAYEACCGPWHAGEPAPTAEALMRSRYSAFVRRDAAYLLRTLHPVERAKPKAGDFRAAFRITWTGLEVLAVVAGGTDDSTGMVHFKAHYQGGVLEERSRFFRIDGAWLYRDGKG